MSKFSKNGRGLVLNSGGFIQIILMVVIGLVLLKYVYGLDIVGSLTQGRFKEVLDKVYKVSSEGWQKYRDTIIGIWNYIFNLIKSFIKK